MSLFPTLLLSYQCSISRLSHAIIMACDLELHAIAIKRCFGMRKPPMRCFFFNDTPVTETISEHLPQFSFVPNILSILLPKNLGFAKEISQNLNKKALYLTILIKIGLTYFKLINKMLTFLWILYNNINIII